MSLEEVSDFTRALFVCCVQLKRTGLVDTGQWEDARVAPVEQHLVLLAELFKPIDQRPAFDARVINPAPDSRADLLSVVRIAQRVQCVPEERKKERKK
jgi:hypothetical protein